MNLPVGIEATILSGAIAGGGYGLVLLAKISNTMGRIDERLGSHDDRIQRLEETIDGAARGTFRTPRVGSPQDLRDRLRNQGT
jgi:hypothetical protein